MGSRKSHVKKENPSVYNLGLFGIIDKAEYTNQIVDSEASFPVALNYKMRKAIRTAALEAEYRKAQAIALDITRRMHYM
ncbi:MAG: hypothetical protein OEZ35_08200 [Candidatus Bathyarchaeota archaeon]|nr:hypothetical protein [Candidatus Bathyarchaeota archaeon]